MSGANLDRSGEGFAAIARDAVRSVGSSALPVWLYIEAGDGWVQPSIYQSGTDSVLYFDPDMDFVDVVEKEWYALEPDQRWAVLEMDIADGQFTTRLRYPGDVPPDGAWSMDRRQAALDARFGDKPVIYPD